MIDSIVVLAVRAVVRASWLIAQVQWYGLGDALRLIGVGVVVGGIVVGMLVACEGHAGKLGDSMRQVGYRNGRSDRGKPSKPSKPKPRVPLSLIDEALNRSLRTSNSRYLNFNCITLICYLIHVRLFDAIPNWDLFENVRKP